MYLNIQKISKTYGNNTVLNNISLQADQGQFITLLGPSGCGKSTLMRILAGLETPSSGTIEINHEDITTLPPQKRQMGMVFQHYALFPNMTALDNILFGLKMRKTDLTETYERAQKIIELVELKGREQHYPSQLSGGQKQRVALARSLIMNPRILLLDEPFSALDAKIRKNLRSQIRTIQRELNLTTLFVTHDQQEALAISDHIVLMYAGKIEQQGDAQSIYTHPATTFAAGFIGNYNVLDSTQSQRYLKRTHPVAIRPETIRINSSQTHPYQFTATIIDSTLHGNIISYQAIADDGLQLNIEILNDNHHPLHQIGETVSLGIAEEHIQALTE